MSRFPERKLTVALAGNPNVGKSTLFNALTGLRQHTGNWPGKTVGVAQGEKRYRDTLFTFVDLPGTYSMEGASPDEQIAGDYLRENRADCTVVVCDGSCLERSLILALEILMCCPRTVICVNLIDEAKRQGISICPHMLSDLLDAPVVFTSAGKGEGLDHLLEKVKETALQMPKLALPKWDDPVLLAEKIAKVCVCKNPRCDQRFRRNVDKLLVSRRFGVPFLFLILLGILWLTVWGANYPGKLLEAAADYGYSLLSGWTATLPWWLSGLLVDGIYAVCARVICVMLPPMAIFFPLFTVLEDIGYLPRMAFLLDPMFSRCGGCGKQALTLCMGLGCNAVGVMGCRIIQSPRERLNAILTNAMVPCNGRFPTLIFLGSLLFAGSGSTLVVAFCVALGVAGAMVISFLLSKTLSKGEDSAFFMEMPPFRRPRLGQILVRSVLDRTLFVAGRALLVAAPAGAALWLLSNTGLLGLVVNFLNPAGLYLGMNGIILLAFLFCLPANELLLPVILLSITQSQSLQATGSIGYGLLGDFFTGKMALCTMVFTLFHWPCGTTLMTVYRETGSIKNTAVAGILPTAVGIALCIVLNFVL